MEAKEYICVLCPNSCQVSVTLRHNDAASSPGTPPLVDNGTIHSVTGHRCDKGKEWVIGEIVEPKRVFLGSVTVSNGVFETVSVKTSGPVPLKYLEILGAYTHSLVVEAPVALYRKVSANVLNLGVDLIATREVAGNSSEARPGSTVCKQNLQ